MTGARQHHAKNEHILHFPFYTSCTLIIEFRDKWPEPPAARLHGNVGPTTGFLAPRSHLDARSGCPMVPHIVTMAPQEESKSQPEATQMVTKVAPKTNTYTSTMSCTLKPSECRSRTCGSTVFNTPKTLPKVTKLQQHDTKYSSFWKSCVSFPSLVPAFVPTFCSIRASLGPFS